MLVEQMNMLWRNIKTLHGFTAKFHGNAPTFSDYSVHVVILTQLSQGLISYLFCEVHCLETYLGKTLKSSFIIHYIRMSFLVYL